MNTEVNYHPEQLPRVVCQCHPEWVAMYERAWQMAFENMEHPGRAGWKSQMTCMPGAGIIWQWDSCLMTFFARFGHRAFSAMNNIDNLYRLQRSDGFMSMAYVIDTEEPAYGERINPPLFAWAEWEYYLLTGDDRRFETALPRLIKFFDWTQAHRTRITGLYWFEDSGSSGMDNSPRSGYYAEKLNGSDICFVDLACQQALTARMIANIARHLQQTSLADRFVEEHATLRKLINDYHWNDRFGFYFDLFGRDSKTARHNFLNHKTLAAMWAMISDVADNTQVDRLVSHLTNPDEFWTSHPLPSLSKDDPNYDTLGGYWLGGVWAPTNYMVAKGLIHCGRRDLARELAVRHLDAIVAVADDPRYASIWECYSPELMQPATSGYNDICRSHFVGWTGLGPIAMLIEHILGIDVDASRNQITWTIQTPGRHGIENLSFNGRSVSLIADAQSSIADASRTVTIDTTADITVAIVSDPKMPPIVRTCACGQHKLTIPCSA